MLGLHTQDDGTHRAPQHVGLIFLLSLDDLCTVSASVPSGRASPGVSLSEPSHVHAPLRRSSLQVAARTLALPLG